MPSPLRRPYSAGPAPALGVVDGAPNPLVDLGNLHPPILVRWMAQLSDGLERLTIYAMKKEAFMLRVGSALALASLVAAAPVRAQAPTSPAPQEPVVAVSGEGLVQATPDRAWIMVSAESRAPSPREAQRRTAEQMRPVLEALRGAKIPDEAVRTTGYDLQQEFDFTNGKRVPRG